MEKKLLKELIGSMEQKDIQVIWWIDTIREHKDFIFIVLRDESDLFQVIVDRVVLGDLKLIPESIIDISWDLILNSSVKLHQRELVTKSLTLISQPIEQLPIWWDQENYPSLDQRLDHRSISLREPKVHFVFELMSFCEYELRKYCYEKWYTEIHTPKLLWSPSESGADLFSLDYFDTKAYLAQSPQFYKQMAIASGYKKVMEVGPVFRAEPSFTSRHLTEFTWIDFEIAHISSFEDVMKVEEELIISLFQSLKETFWDKILKIYWIDLEVPSLPFPRIEFRKCIEILEKEYWYKILEGEDISSEWERLIYEYVKKTYGHDFVFITHYPSKVRAFYTMKSIDSKRSESFDLIYKWVEITSWAQREHRYEILKQQIIEKGMSPEHMQYYLDFFKYWIPPHGWFWIWMMRIFMKMLDFKSIKEVTFLPRDPKRLTP